MSSQLEMIVFGYSFILNKLIILIGIHIFVIKKPLGLHSYFTFYLYNNFALIFIQQTPTE